MAKTRSDDLFPETRNSESVWIINERCSIRTEDRWRVVLLSGSRCPTCGEALKIPDDPRP